MADRGFSQLEENNKGGGEGGGAPDICIQMNFRALMPWTCIKCPGDDIA